MKRLIAAMCSLLLLIGSFTGTGRVSASKELGWSLPHVYATFMDNTVDVLDEVMEVQSNIAAPMSFELDYETPYVPVTFSLFQMKGTDMKELMKSDTTSFSIDADKLEIGWPVYLRIHEADTDRVLGIKLLNIRVNKNAILEKVPDNLEKEFNSAILVNMDRLLPGMVMDVISYLIPVTVKTYEDGRVRVGIGVNSSDVDFWEKAAMGELPTDRLASDMQAIFSDDPHRIDDISGKGMGVVFLFSGWAEGNVNTNDPIKGHLQFYVGTGFNITGQYGIFTWNITLTGGSDNLFDFSFVYSPEDSEYHFQTEEVRLGIKGGLEVYGGVGCSLASVGVYGAGSIAYQQELYPNGKAEHLVLAGELGLKAKLFGKVLASYQIVSGSWDFVNEKDKIEAGMLLPAKEFTKQLLENEYGKTVGALQEPNGKMLWNGENVSSPSAKSGWIDKRDFAHLLSTDIYADNQVQIVNGADIHFPEMRIAFLGSDMDRAPGNRSVLMSSYFSTEKDFVSEPAAVADDGTADLDPYLYSGGPDAMTCVVWKNALSPLTADMSFTDIAAATDLYFAKHYVGLDWNEQERVTNYAGSGRYAAGARLTVNAEGQAVVAYYTSDVNDPAGLAGSHELFFAVRTGEGVWETKSLGSISGAVTDFSSAMYGGAPAAAVSTERDGVQRVTVFTENGNSWERKYVSCGRFLEVTSKNAVLSYYKEGTIMKRSADGNESAMTPEDLTIPETPYELFGNPDKAFMITGSTFTDDGSTDAYAYVSMDGCKTFTRSDLTQIGPTAYVNHFAAAFTAENEPVLLYSVQHYDVNVDLEGTLADPASAKKDDGPRITLGEDDERFSDTETELWISAREANRHVAIEGAKTVDPGTLKPGEKATVALTLRNTGLYDVEHADILLDGEKIAALDQKLAPWETADVNVTLELPHVYGTETFTYTLDAAVDPERGADARITVPVDPGYETVRIWHGFKFGQEEIRFLIENKGYTNKTAKIIVRDEKQDITLQERTVRIDSQGYLNSSYKAKDELFVREGLQNVTLYVQFDDAETGAESVSTSQQLSIIPLDEVYGQEYEVIKGDGIDDTDDSSAAESETDSETPQPAPQRGVPVWVWIAIAAAVSVIGGITAAALITKKKKKEKDSAG